MEIPYLFIARRTLPGLDVNGTKYLYSTNYNYADFNVDDNGLWVIYGTQDSNNTIVAKVMKTFMPRSDNPLLPLLYFLPQSGHYCVGLCKRLK